MDELLREVEQAVLAHDSGRYSDWVGRELLALRGEADADRRAVAAHAATVEDCLNDIRADMERHSVERAEAFSAAREHCMDADTQFGSSLLSLEREREAEAAGMVTDTVARVREKARDAEGTSWEDFANTLKLISWDYVAHVRDANLTEGFAEQYERGEVQPYLDKEKETWERNQREDIRRLRAEIEAEHKSVFTQLEARLKSLSPDGVLAHPLTAKLSEAAGSEKKRLALLEAEMRLGYEPEVAAALRQNEKDYQRYDLELQNALLRNLTERGRSAAHMRRLKLALCRWRLDYQGTYHERRRVLDASSPRSGGPPASADAHQPDACEDTALEQQLFIRRQMLHLWASSKVPLAEIHRFLGEVSEAAVWAGCAEPIMQIYRDELQQYGALPLLEYVRQPELLECWLQSLKTDTRRAASPSTGGPGSSPAYSGGARGFR